MAEARPHFDSSTLTSSDLVRKLMEHLTDFTQRLSHISVWVDSLGENFRRLSELSGRLTAAFVAMGGLPHGRLGVLGYAARGGKGSSSSSSPGEGGGGEFSWEDARTELLRYHDLKKLMLLEEARLKEQLFGKRKTREEVQAERDDRLKAYRDEVLQKKKIRDDAFADAGGRKADTRPEHERLQDLYDKRLRDALVLQQARLNARKGLTNPAAALAGGLPQALEAIGMVVPGAPLQFNPAREAARGDLKDKLSALLGAKPGEVAALDLETTGKGAPGTPAGRVVQIGAHRLNPETGLPETFSRLLKPGGRFTEEQFNEAGGAGAHKFSFKELQEKGVDVREALEDLAKFLAPAKTLVGQNSKAFDLPRLLEEFHKADLGGAAAGLEGKAHFDTLEEFKKVALAQLIGSSKPGTAGQASYSQPDVARALGLDTSGAHKADFDAAQLFEILRRVLGVLDGTFVPAARQASASLASVGQAAQQATVAVAGETGAPASARPGKVDLIAGMSAAGRKAKKQELYDYVAAGMTAAGKGPQPGGPSPSGWDKAFRALAEPFAAAAGYLKKLFSGGARSGGAGGKPPVPGEGAEGGGWEAFQKGLGDSTRQFMLLGSVLGHLVDAASPDTFATFTGSVKIAAAVLGQELIPFFVGLSRGIQEFAAWVQGLNPVGKQMAAGFAINAAKGLMAGAALQLLGAVITSTATKLGLLVLGLDNLLEAVTELGKSLWNFGNGAPDAKKQADSQSRRGREALRDINIGGVNAQPELGAVWNDFVRGDITADEARKRLAEQKSKFGKEAQGFAEEAGRQDVEAAKQGAEKSGLEKVGRAALRGVFPLGGLGLDLGTDTTADKKRQAEAAADEARQKEAEARRKMNLADYAAQAVTNKSKGLGLPGSPQYAALQEAEKNSRMSNFLYSVQSFRATPSYSSIEQSYKNIQIAALGKDPIQQALDKLHQEGVLKMLAELEKSNEIEGSLLESVRAIVGAGR